MLDSLVREHRVVICVGGGGVGKTTVAAAIALGAARAGRRTVVMTIDPARRLADALGLGTLADEPRPVDRDLAARDGVAIAGELWAMMLSQKTAWDRLVTRHAPTPEVRASILSNRFYLHLSRTFAGSFEYMAIEQLCLLAESGEWDLIVVDTPPTRHALDFFDAPARIRAFLDRRMARWLLLPYSPTGGWVARAMGATAGAVLRTLEQATSIEVLVELSQFFSAMSGLFDAFVSRSRQIDRLLRGPDAALVLVGGPDEGAAREAEHFADEMRARHLPVGAAVVNRIHGAMPIAGGAEESPAEIVAALGRAGIEGPDAAWMAATFVAHRTLSQAQSRRLAHLRAALPAGVPLVAVPNLAADVHDLPALLRLGDCLFDRR